MKQGRRRFLRNVGTTGVYAALGNTVSATGSSTKNSGIRRFRYIQIDVFTLQRLQGNPLAVFLDARGLSDTQMQDLARETNLQETTFVFPRDAAVEREHGVQARIYVPGEEIPFGGHPALGTAMVLRNLSLATQEAGLPKNDDLAELSLDLRVGRITVRFRRDSSGNVFGEMRQVDPEFGPIHDRNTIADLLDLTPGDISTDASIQSISTGLPFIIVPIKSLSALQRLTAAPRKAYDCVRRQKLPDLTDFYYVTLDTGDSAIGLRSRGIYPTGEDPATGSAAGCAAAWMVSYSIAQPDQTVQILQGVEIKRPSHIFVRAGKDGDKIDNVRVGGYAVPVMEGTLTL